MKFKPCQHDMASRPLRWTDTAGREWVDDDCKKCGRVWRNCMGAATRILRKFGAAT